MSQHVRNHAGIELGRRSYPEISIQGTGGKLPSKCVSGFLELRDLSQLPVSWFWGLTFEFTGLARLFATGPVE